MKKISCLLLVTLCLNIVQAQWTSITTTITNATFHTVYFMNSSTGFAIGSDATGGVVLKTTDGGSTWNNNINIQPYNLMEACFTSSTTGYICGANASNSQAIVLKTTDGGATWTANQVASSYPLLHIHFYDANHGFTSDIHGSFFKTNDGGNTWTLVNGGWGPGSVQGIFYLNNNSVYIVGDDVYGGVRKSTDGGTTWTTLPHPALSMINDIYFTNTDTAWCVGSNGSILKTIDGGNTWLQQTSGSTSMLLSVYFINGQEGYAVGLNGTILKTINGGTNWTTETSNTSSMLYSVYFVSSQQGYAVGSSSTITSTFTGNYPAGTANEISSNQNVYAYPNPFTSSFRLIGNSNHTYSLNIVDMQGKLKYKTINTIQRINEALSSITSWSKGVYCIELNDLNTQEAKLEKLIKQ